MSTPWEWHQRELGKLADLAETEPHYFFLAGPEAGATWLLALVDGLRSLTALCAAAQHPVLLVDGDEGGASP